MANPQKENGSTDIANELLEAIYSMNFNGSELAIILCILRYTYGFHRKDHCLSLNFIAKATNKHKINVSNTINNLIKNNVLIETKKPSFNSVREVGINKDYSKWIDYQLAKQLTVSKKTNTTVSQMTNSPVGQMANQETKKETKKETKNIYGEFGRIRLTQKEYDKLCEDYGKDVIDRQITSLDEYVESNNNKNKYTNFNLVLRRSLRDKWFEKKMTQVEKNRAFLERMRKEHEQEGN